MGSNRSFLLRITCALAIVILASCDSVSVYRIPAPRRGPGIGHGPPAHAKAHGYRRKQVHGYDLVYDSSCGVYVVVGMSDCYYHDGYFYRLHGDVWEISVRARDWSPAGARPLPPGLRAKGKTKAKSKGFAKGKGKF